MHAPMHLFCFDFEAFSHRKTSSKAFLEVGESALNIPNSWRWDVHQLTLNTHWKMINLKSKISKANKHDLNLKICDSPSLLCFFCVFFHHTKVTSTTTHRFKFQKLKKNGKLTAASPKKHPPFFEKEHHPNQTFMTLCSSRWYKPSFISQSEIQKLELIEIHWLSTLFFFQGVYLLTVVFFRRATQFHTIFLEWFSGNPWCTLQHTRHGLAPSPPAKQWRSTTPGEHCTLRLKKNQGMNARFFSLRVHILCKQDMLCIYIYNICTACMHLFICLFMNSFISAAIYLVS